MGRRPKFVGEVVRIEIDLYGVTLERFADMLNYLNSLQGPNSQRTQSQLVLSTI